MERGRPRSLARLAFGLAPIDAVLPGGGLGAGLHEFAACGRDAPFAAAPIRLAAHLFGRAGSEAPVLWVTDRRDLHPPGLAGAGLPPHRLLVAEAPTREVLASMEEGARTRGLAGVVGEIGDALTLTVSRRLLLAAEMSGVPVIAIRRPHRGVGAGSPSPVDAPNAAITRWRIATLPSAPADPIEAGPFSLTVARALWRLDLVRARFASPSSWIVEAFDETGRLAFPAPSRDRPGRPGDRLAAVARHDAAGDRAA